MNMATKTTAKVFRVFTSVRKRVGLACEECASKIANGPDYILKEIPCADDEFDEFKCTICKEEVVILQ